MTVKEIIEKHLTENGFDGLYNPDGQCGCNLSDLVPCDEWFSPNCVPGHKIPCDPEICSADGDCDFHIGEPESVEGENDG